MATVPSRPSVPSPVRFYQRGRSGRSMQSPGVWAPTILYVVRHLSQLLIAHCFGGKALLKGVEIVSQVECYRGCSLHMVTLRQRSTPSNPPPPTPKHPERPTNTQETWDSGYHVRPSLSSNALGYQMALFPYTRPFVQDPWTTFPSKPGSLSLRST